MNEDIIEHIAYDKGYNKGYSDAQENLAKKFEKNFSQFIGQKFSTFVNSGSSANLLIFMEILGEFLKLLL